MNGGQVCTSIERVYAEETIYESFLDKVVQKVRSLRQGLSSEEVEVGSMTSEEQFRKVSSQVNEALAQGARALTGGSANGKFSGFFYEPTVLVDVNHQMAVVKDETFGPVIPIVKVRNAEEAARMANDSRFGLDACVFCGNKRQALKLADQLQTGTVCINDALVNYIITDAPMGGMKDSGFSRRHGAEGIRKFCRQKTIIIDRFGLKRDFPWFPASRRKTEQMRRLINLLWRSGWKNKFSPPKKSKLNVTPLNSNSYSTK